MATTFRHSAAFGKRIEYWIIGRMLKDGLDVYVPLVDDDAVDALVKRKDGTIAQVQIKARSKNVVLGDAALFSAITHDARQDYWFIFYSERLEKTWLLSSGEFISECVQNKTGKNVGTRSIWFNGTRKDVEYAKSRFEKYEAGNFLRLDPVAVAIQQEREWLDMRAVGLEL